MFHLAYAVIFFVCLKFFVCSYVCLADASLQGAYILLCPNPPNYMLQVMHRLAGHSPALVRDHSLVLAGGMIPQQHEL
jgi:hypothetical protein